MNKLENDEIVIEVEDTEFDDLGNPLPEFEEKYSAVSSQADLQVLNDDNISQEQINEMKMLGIYKPPGVSWERWQRIQDVRGEHEHMIHLAASGVPQGQIAEMLGYDQAHVSKILRTPEIKTKVDAQIAAIYGEDIKKALRDRAKKSIGVVDEILSAGSKEAERASMAKWVLEHTVGKPTQDINVQKTTLTEVIFQIDQLKQSGQLRDVNGLSQDLQKPKDHFDTIIEQVIPSGMVVGKRSEESNEGKN